ncbi:hypothetical protein Cni_G27260 [Canna indica]|uniref:Uncharacterized protein n=1 Tax=Canna indica TaxID=4628 RepID=A0AAQ3QP51_9LILI|nr:hypothetical protein Cni_G27260 [Canna indica]
MAKGFRNLNRAKPQYYGVGLLAVFILVSLTYLTMSRTNKLRVSMGKPLSLYRLHVPIILSASQLLITHCFSASSQLIPILSVNSTSIKSDASAGQEEGSHKEEGFEKSSSVHHHEEIPAQNRPNELGMLHALHV